MPQGAFNSRTILAQSVENSDDSNSALSLANRVCTLLEEQFAQLYSLYRNQARAYREAFGQEDCALQTAWNMGCRIAGRPWVQRRIREINLQAAHAIHLDVVELFKHDLDIIRAADHADQLTTRVWWPCRHCHGIDHQYQWIDANEWALATAEVLEFNSRVSDAKLHRGIPSDSGGYGFTVNVEPSAECPKCFGLGDQRSFVADTRNLPAEVKPLYKGIRETKNGTEVLMHDVDKAKERLLRAAGAFGDEAAVMLRKLIEGRSANASGAQMTQEAATPEAALRLYLEVSQ